MPYTAQHLYGFPTPQVAEDAEASRKLNASSDADAVREADVWLRSSRVLARFSGEVQPIAEVVLRDGQEFARIVLDRIQDETVGMGPADYDEAAPIF
jgi:hypothetical protein